MADTQFYGTGKRKNAVARVFLRPGTGQVTVNSREFDDYFPSALQRADAMRPLEVVDQLNKFDLFVTVKGGGLSGQSGAVRHGVARALLATDPDLRPKLKEHGFLTRDAREKERKKYGQRGARARFQFSKR